MVLPEWRIVLNLSTECKNITMVGFSIKIINTIVEIWQSNNFPQHCLTSAIEVCYSYVFIIFCLLMSQVGEEVAATYTRGENGSPASMTAPAHIRDVDQFAVVHQKLSTSAYTVVTMSITQIHTSCRQQRASAITAQVATVPATAATPADAVKSVSHYFSSAVTVHGSQEY